MPERESRPFRLRVHACPRGGDWDFFAENADARRCDGLCLETVTYTWGSSGERQETRVECGALAPGASVRIWSDGSDAAEIHIDLAIVVESSGERFRGVFELPKLYRLGHATEIEAIARPGHSFEQELSRLR